MKKYIIIKWLLLFSIIFLIFSILQGKNTSYTLFPGQQISFTIKKHTTSLDSISIVSITGQTKNAKLRLFCGADWFDIDNDINYNITTSRIEKLKYDKSTNQVSTIELPNPSNGVEVVHKGIVIESSQKRRFAFKTDSDMSITVQNITDKTIRFQLEINYE